MNRGISKSKVMIQSFKHDHNRNILTQHVFNYLLKKGYEVEKGQTPFFLSNVGESRKEIRKVLELYVENFSQAKKDKILGQSTSLLAKGIVFNLPNSMTQKEITEHMRRIMDVLPHDMPQVFVHHRKSKRNIEHAHTHLLLCVRKDGSQIFEDNIRFDLQENLIKATEQYLSVLGYRREVHTPRNQATSNEKNFIRKLAEIDALSEGHSDLRATVARKLQSAAFYQNILEDRIKTNTPICASIKSIAKQKFDALELKQISGSSVPKTRKPKHYDFEIPVDEASIRFIRGEILGPAIYFPSKIIGVKVDTISG